MKNITDKMYEGFFSNVGTMSPALWLSKLKYMKPDTQFWEDRWNKKHLCKIDGSKLILMYDDNECVFDFAKGLLWTSFVKFCDPADEYVFIFEPDYGRIYFKLRSKKRLGLPAVFICFDENMKIFDMKIFNKELLGIDDKLYKSKGCDAAGYIYNRALIKYFIG